jgi:sugar phosphate isomerase/epimerase
MADGLQLALHTWTIDATPLDLALRAAKEGGYDAVELRHLDFVRCKERGQSRNEIVEAIRGSGMKLGILGTEYGWLFAPPAEKTRLFEVLRETCEIAAALCCGTIMSAPGQNVGTIAEAIASTKHASDIVGQFGLKLALEFNSQHDVVNRTSVLRKIIAGAGRSNCGMLLDAYHLHRSEGVAAGLRDVRGEEVFVFQYSDAPSSPVTGIRRPIDRLPPGEGVIDWDEFLGIVRGIGYRGYLSYEAPNPVLWEQDPVAVAVDGARRIRSLLERSQPAPHSS